MSREKDEKNTREIRNRILDAAEKLFSEKSFDATGITEIAAQASVTKSLIYYYFENKNALLDAIVNRLLEANLKMKAEVAPGALDSLKLGDTDTLYRYVLDHSLPFIENYRRAMKIVLMEEMKTPAEGPLFRYYKKNTEAALKYFEDAGLPIRDYQEFSSFFFFMALFPGLGYLVLGEEWCQHTGMKLEDLRIKLASWMSELFSMYSFKRGYLPSPPFSRNPSDNPPA